MCPTIRCNGRADEGSSGRDSSGDHNRAENVGVKYNYNLRGEGMIGQSGSDSEKGENCHSHSVSRGCGGRVCNVQMECDREEKDGGISAVKTMRHKRWKGLWELGESSTVQQRKTRVGAGSIYAGSCPESRVSKKSYFLSDGDIVKCNSRCRKEKEVEEPSAVWEVGKQLGVACHRVESDVIMELERMEVRDLEVVKKYKEGNKESFL